MSMADTQQRSENRNLIEEIRSEIDRSVSDRLSSHILRRDNDLIFDQGLIYYVRYDVGEDAGLDLENQARRVLAEARLEQALNFAGPGVQRVELHPAGRAVGVKMWIRGNLDETSKMDLDAGLDSAMTEHVDRGATRGVGDKEPWEVRCVTGSPAR